MRSRGFDQAGDCVLDYVRWVMVRKRDEAAPAPRKPCPALPKAVEPAQLGAACPKIDAAAYDTVLAGSPHRFGDYQAGEKIDHVDGITVEEAEHMMATRLYQNTARVHFNQFTEAQGPLRPPADLWRPRHFAGARAVVQRARQCLPRGGDQWRAARGAAVCRPHRVRLVGSAGDRRRARPQRRRRPAPAHRRHQGSALPDFPLKDGEDYDPAVILDLDYWVLMPR